jgi:hypothetical protein
VRLRDHLVFRSVHMAWPAMSASHDQLPPRAAMSASVKKAPMSSGSASAQRASSAARPVAAARFSAAGVVGVQGPAVG